MEKRSKTNLSSKLKSDGVDNSEAVSYTTSEQSVSVVCKFPASITIRGLMTGKLYEWSGAGVVVEVAKVDVEDILTKKIGEMSCCGNNQRGNILFELV